MKVCAPFRKYQQWLLSALVCLDPKLFFLSATPEPGEDPRVTRAKFFIRDEFLVSVSMCGCPRVIRLVCVFFFKPQSCSNSFRPECLVRFAELVRVDGRYLVHRRKISVHDCCSVPLTSVPLVPLSGSALRAAMADTTAIHTSPVLWTQRTSDGCSTTAGTSSRECTCGSTNSCDGRHQRSSALCFSPPFYILEELFLSLLLLLLKPFATPDRPSCQRLWSTTEVCQIFLVSSSFYI